MRHTLRFVPVLVLLAFVTCLSSVQAADPVPQHAIAMHGAPKYPADFTHFDYVNPEAPKEGDLREHALGTFDSLNPFIVKGQPAAGSEMPFETLLTASADEPFTEYGLIAESMEFPPDRRWVIFNLRPEARFHDGSPITADDVLFSFETLKTQGRPFYRSYYRAVVKVEKLTDHKVRFVFVPSENHELPLILGQMPILSKGYWQTHSFDQTTLDPPLGSGPYKIDSIDPGHTVVLKRVPNYWGKDLPVNKGLNNFDTIHIDYYRDSTVALEAFKAGEYDIKVENESKKWATGYDFPAVTQGQIKLKAFHHQRSSGMQGYVFNLRRPLWQDVRVRHALTLAFDFDWTNKNLFYGQYERDTSFFSNSLLASSGLPSDEEKKILEPLRGKIPDEVFTTPFTLPSTTDKGGIRENLREAAHLLKDAGWIVRNGKLVDGKTNQPFIFEVLLDQPIWERITLPFIDNLKRLGITATVRTVDSAQYKNRTDNFDYDMIVDVWGESESPGNEQRDFWGSEAADQPGSRNSVGIKDKAIDQLIDLVISAPDRESLETRVHALDRVLLWNYYVLPHWHVGTDRVAYWDKFGMPETIPSQGVQLMAWWADPMKSVKLPRKPAPKNTKGEGQ